MQKQDEPAVSTNEDQKRDETDVQTWSTKLKAAKDYRRPHDKRWLRFYYLYRAYRNDPNYPYITNNLPPIAFEIVETVKPRLAAAKLKTVAGPTKAEDVGNESLSKWDNLVNYYFKKMNLMDNKITWIDLMLKYGNGLAEIAWDAQKGHPAMSVLDNYLVYLDPDTGERLQGMKYYIKFIYKTKAQIIKDEERRGTGRLYNARKLEELEDEVIRDDPRADRDSITTLKMGQIGRKTDRTTQTPGGSEESGTGDSRTRPKAIELMEIHDILNGKLITIGNQKGLLRSVDHPYKDMKRKHTLVDLACIKLPFEYYAMSMIEPVETLINELADSRNQAMDNILFNLDPIKKIRKGANIKLEDLKSRPGAAWEMPNADDVVTERPPEISKSWLEKDGMLRGEIDSALALSEYLRGMQQSSSEPLGKVELLLMQTNIRFSQLVRQLELAMEDVVEIVVDMTKQFATEDQVMEIVGDDVEFGTFTDEDRNVDVAFRMEIEPVQEKSPEKRKAESIELREAFLGEPPQDPNEMAQYKKRRRALDELVLREYGKEEYIDAILGPEEDETTAPIEAPQPVERQTVEEAPQPPDLSPIPLISPEDAMVTPQATTPMTAPNAGFLKGLLKRVKGRVG